MAVTREEIVAVLKLVVQTAQIIGEEYVKNGTATPESSLYLVCDSDMDKYRRFALLLEKCGMIRKNHAWQPAPDLALSIRMALEEKEKILAGN